MFCAATLLACRRTCLPALPYLAAFHAGQALIFEKTGTVAKKRPGVRARHRVTDEPDCDAELRSFLGRDQQFQGHRRLRNGTRH
jgi:hypothetical protein